MFTSFPAGFTLYTVNNEELTTQFLDKYRFFAITNREFWKNPKWQGTDY